MNYYRTPNKPIDGLSVTLAKTMGLRDPFLLTHSLNVAVFAMKVARRLGISEDQVDTVRRSSLLHDIGKLGISQDILSKPAGLTEQEYETLKTHPALGAALLHECPDYQTLIPIVRHHHEFFNGRGYPDGLAGAEIEIEARIVSVAEAIDVMLSENPYRDSWSIPEVIIELRQFSKVQFDPLVVETAIQLLTEAEIERRTDGSAAPRTNQSL